MGTFLGHDESLAKESKKNSETVVKDKEFMAAVTHLEKSAVVLQKEATRKSEPTLAQKIVAVEEAPKVQVPVVTPVPVPAKPKEYAGKLLSMLPAR